MPLADTAFLALETAFNEYIALDDEISRQFAELHGRVIGFDLSGSGITMFFIPEQNGRVQITGILEGDPDCFVKGSVFSLLRSHFEQNPDQVFQGDIKIEGNAALAQKFTAIIKQIDIDWEEQLSRHTGDILANQIGQNFRKTTHWVQQSAATLGLNLQEYLQEEAKFLPTVFELDEFNNNVDTLRDDVERLEARIRKLTIAPENQDTI
jgi:ubiquinone biosynthesis protein UbiJ